MPRLGTNDPTMETHQMGASNFSFSAKRIGELGASEYTLALLVIDCSPSIEGFTDEMEQVVKEVAKACRRSPRADNLMLRVVTFNSTVDEFHGFKPLSECNEDDYDGCIQTKGLTALYDATYNGIQSMVQYGRDLTEQDFDVNGAVFVITDGLDNRSKLTRDMVKSAMKEAVKAESMESIISVLIGVNASQLRDYLKAFSDESGFTQYVEIADANEKTLAKLGQFISKSISSQSQALGTGGPSQSLSF